MTASRSSNQRQVPRRRPRSGVRNLEQIPNVGPRIASDFRLLGLHEPRALAGQDPYALYEMLNASTGVRQDPCVLDTFIAAVRYMEGAPRRPWWFYTAERKRRWADGNRA